MAYAAISKPSSKMNTKLYTGTGASNALTGVGFQPDLVWNKIRSTTGSGRITDAVRGVTKEIYPDLTDAEATQTEGVTAFGADGFTVGTNAGYNTNAATYAGWCFKANGAGSANTDGSTSCTVSADSSAGFSIIKFAGTGGNHTIGHGLGAAPEMLWFRNLSQTANWICYHKDLQSSSGKQMYLNLNNAQGNDTSYLQNTAPDASIITLGANADSNGSGNNIACYAFKSIKGYSKIGKFNGNGNTNGAFVYTGFKPRFVIIKVGYASAGTDFANHWFIFDSQLNGYNGENEYLKCDTNEAISSGTNRIDILSNGFKCRTSNDGVNSSSGVYMYYAVAEEPLVANVGSSIPATAR